MFLGLLVSFLALALHSIVQGFPAGAPLCAINEARISKVHSPPSSLNYGVSAQANGDSIDIRLTGPSSFKGILMYVTSGSAQELTHLGSFQGLDAASFKFQTDICGNEGIGGSPESTLTHINSYDKPSTATVFAWKPLANDPTTGLKLHVVINNGVRAWQHSSFDLP